LGPLLFLVYINDISLNIQGAKLVLYADDTNVLVIERNEEVLKTKLLSVMEQLERWFHKNEFVVNTTKTAAVSFYLSHTKPSIKPPIFKRNTEIQYKSKVHLLGLRVNENLSWHAHICSLCHSLSRTFFMIKSVKNTLSNHALWNIYYAYFHSRLRYGLILWWGDKRMHKNITPSKKGD
jgi:hypothetical protein